jgi:hypothetical protein
MMQEHGERIGRYGRVVAGARLDPAFRRRLLADPAGAPRARGIEVAA